MASRQSALLISCALLALMGAAYPTTNFMVEAPTPQIAQQIGQAAEYYRRQKAIEWLGQEMPPWPERCPLHVTLTYNGPGGATSFAFDRGRVLGQQMNIEGPLDRLVASVLPHEVTHTVFAYYFRRPVPRWADEGGAVLSEDEIEKERHDRLVRQILNTPGRRIPLRSLFNLHDYPSDVMVLYAEGFSVSDFLVSTNGRKTFLDFVNLGLSTNGWDYAVRSFYPYQSIEQLEAAWLTHLRDMRHPRGLLAQNSAGAVPADPARRIVGVQPAGQNPPVPIFRAQSDQESDRPERRAAALASIRPGYLPDYDPTRGIPSGPTPQTSAQGSPRGAYQGSGTVANAAQPAYQPQPGPYAGPQIQLGAPQPVPAGSYGSPPGSASPVGYPR